MNGPRQLCVKVIPTGGTMCRVHNIDKTVDFETAINKAIAKRLVGKKHTYVYAQIDGAGASAKLLEVKANCSYQGW